MEVTEDHVCHVLAKLYHTNPYWIDDNYTPRQIEGWLRIEGDIQKRISDSVRTDI